MYQPLKLDSGSDVVHFARLLAVEDFAGHVGSLGRFPASELSL
jgi:hypothetical protein